MIISIESATPRGSVALLDGTSAVGEKVLPDGVQTSASYLSAVDALLRENGVTPDRVAAVAVSAGPGSFTGLRVGMAAAKGLCFGWGVPIVPVSTLHALAMRFPSEGGVVCAVLDARKREVYAALFRWEGGESVRMSPDRALAPEDLPGILPAGPVLFCGDGVDVCRPHLSGSHGIPPRGEDLLPRAAAVGLLAARLVREGGAADPRDVVPRYLRSSEAEMKKGREPGAKIDNPGPSVKIYG